MSESPFPGYESVTLTDYESLKEREESLLEKLLAILLILLHDGMPFLKGYELGSEFILEEFNAVIEDANRKAALHGLPIIPPERVQAILSQALSDFETELKDLELEKQGKAPKKGSVIERVVLTSWFVTWVTHQNAVVEIAKQGKIVEVIWVTMADGSVCEICLENAGVHRLSELPEFPAHPGCRCWLELIMPSPREKLDMKFDIAQRLRNR